MFSELKSFSLMGLPNSEIFFSEKDLNTKEFDFLVSSTLELGDDCETATQELHQEKELEEVNQEKELEEVKEEDKCEVLVSTLKIKIPSFGPFQIEDSDDEGFKTPTSSDRKIPVVFQCPPAPRKPKSLLSTKRKSPRRRVLLDLSNEIDSLAAKFGGEFKKARHGNDTK